MELDQLLKKISINDPTGPAIAKGLIVVVWMILETLKSIKGK